MSKKAPGYAARTHDLHAVRPHRDKTHELNRIGLLLRTDTGKHFHVFFEEDESILGAVVLAVPNGLTLDTAVDHLSRAIEHVPPALTDPGGEEVDGR